MSLCCINRMEITGEAAELDVLLRWVVGDLPLPFYQLAINRSIKLLAAGMAGLRRPVLEMRSSPMTPVRFPPLPQLVGPDITGESTPENKAFSEWLVLLKYNFPLNVHTCCVISKHWRDSGLQDVRWQDMTAEQQAIIDALFDDMASEWSLALTPPETNRWDELDTCLGAEKPMPMDMRTLLHTFLAQELNGYTGKLWQPVPGDAWFWREHQPECCRRQLYSRLYGLERPWGENVRYERPDATTLMVTFDSGWGLPAEKVFLKISRFYNVRVKHSWLDHETEQCGLVEYDLGKQVSSVNETLEYSEPDEECDVEVEGPFYVLPLLESVADES